LIGQLLAGRFRLTEKIGQGGMGAVYKAIQIKIDRICAVKLLTPTAGDSELAVARFSREAQMASHIDSPHAVTIYDFGESEAGAFFLAMEYIDGQSLSQILEQAAPLPIERVVRIVRQIAAALSSAHALGIIHRDLKPDNVMITQKGSDTDYVKVLDFGIAKAVAEGAHEKLTETGFVLGTPIYMSPEQLSGDDLDARSDVYSLALIAYEMLSGRLPFEGGNPQAITIKRVTTDPIPLRAFAAGLSPEIERVIMSGLTRDRSHRTPTVQQLAHDLEASSGRSRVTSAGRERLGRETVADASLSELMGTEAGSQEDGGVGGALPPSAYVTRVSSVDSDALPRAAPTVRVDRSSVETGIEAIEAGKLPYSARARSDDYATVRDRKAAVTIREERQQTRSGRRSWIAVAVVLAVLAAGGTGAYFIFFRATPPKPNDGKNGTGLVSPTPEENLTKVAVEHYKSGERYQEEARLFAEQNSMDDSARAHSKAIDEYLEAVTVKPMYPEAHENLGVSYYYVGRLDTAIKQYEIAIDQYLNSGQPPPAHVYINYALALFDSMRYADAATAFGRAIEMDPSDPDLLAHRAFALQNAGLGADANSDYRRYLQVAPSGGYATLIRRILDGRAQPPATSGNR
jgi:serine/threonine-protein kinase